MSRQRGPQSRFQETRNRKDLVGQLWSRSTQLAFCRGTEPAQSCQEIQKFLGTEEIFNLVHPNTFEVEQALLGHCQVTTHEQRRLLLQAFITHA